MSINSIQPRSRSIKDSEGTDFYMYTRAMVETVAQLSDIGVKCDVDDDSSGII